ncbi:hypothetical protein Gohar_025825, partial [Gossypium harknessii]|nr:hypothetical protein [Gossypium harknessii]
MSIILTCNYDHTKYEIWNKLESLNGEFVYMQESSKSIQIEAFHVFKLFAANQNKPADIVSILVANKSKLLRLFADFKTDKEDEQFEADKAQVVKEIASLE